MRDDQFAPLHQAVEPLAGLACPWFVVGGWAIDLHLGRVSRAHGDVDLAVYRRDQGALHAFLTARGWAVRQVVAGGLAYYAPEIPLLHKALTSDRRPSDP